MGHSLVSVGRCPPHLQAPLSGWTGCPLLRQARLRHPGMKAGWQVTPAPRWGAEATGLASSCLLPDRAGKRQSYFSPLPELWMHGDEATLRDTTKVKGPSLRPWSQGSRSGQGFGEEQRGYAAVWDQGCGTGDLVPEEPGRGGGQVARTLPKERVGGRSGARKGETETKDV